MNELFNKWWESTEKRGANDIFTKEQLLDFGKFCIKNTDCPNDQKYYSGIFPQ